MARDAELGGAARGPDIAKVIVGDSGKLPVPPRDPQSCAMRQVRSAMRV